MILSKLKSKNYTAQSSKPNHLPEIKRKTGRKLFPHGTYCGCLTILSKFQNDIKTTENKVIAFCHEQVGKVILRFDAFEAIVGQNSNI